MEEKTKYILEVSKRIKKIREKLNMTKSKMAEELDIVKQTYYTLELGTRKLQIEGATCKFKSKQVASFLL